MKNKRQIKAFSVESKIRRGNGSKTRALSQKNSFLYEASTNCSKSGTQDPSFRRENSLEISESLPSNLKNIEPTLAAMNGYASLRNNISRGDVLRQGYFTNEVLVTQRQFSSARKPLQGVRLDSRANLTKKRLDDIKIQNTPKKNYFKVRHYLSLLIL